jgi:hypothetical protein
VTSGRATDEVVRDRVMAGVSVPDSPLIRDVLAFPRLHMKQKFAETCRRLVAAKPETSSDNFLRDFGERFVPGYTPVSTVDLLMGSPFEE